VGEGEVWDTRDGEVDVVVAEVGGGGVGGALAGDFRR